MNYFEVREFMREFENERSHRLKIALEGIKAALESGHTEDAKAALESLIQWVDHGEPVGDLESVPIPDESMGIAWMDDGYPGVRSDAWFALILQCGELVEALESHWGNGHIVKDILTDGMETAARWEVEQ